MVSLLQSNEFLNELESEHRRWLSSFSPQHLRNFEKVRNGEYEAAMTEAAVRRFLERHRVFVEPGEELTGRRSRPDFLCSHNGSSFYVEVTCITIQNVVEQTGLPYPSVERASHYSPLNDAIWSKCKGKAEQCSDLDHPALVAIGTHHFAASALCIAKSEVEMLLTGTANLSLAIDSKTGRRVGDPFLSTDLRSAVFLRTDECSGIGFARSSLSGLLLCGFGLERAEILGVLHPNPVRQFERATLPDVSFCDVTIDRETGMLSTRWNDQRE